MGQEQARRLEGWAAVAPGTALKELVKTPSSRDIFMFSAVTWNRHAIHYSSESARSEGLRDVVVQRALLGNYLAQLITQWVGADGDLECLEWKVVHSAFPGDRLVCSGEVTANVASQSGRLLECVVRVQNQSAETVALGQARVRVG
jgi:hydroxyacyl-ACP dehydratase HTD2-like protein with hotdog domain